MASATVGSGYGAPNTEFSERSVEDKVIVVTGGSRGIGYDLAMSLAKRKARLVLTARTESELATAVSAIKAATGNENVVGFPCDIGDVASVKAFAAKVAEIHDRVHILYNNASIMPGIQASMANESEEHTLNMFRINMDGYYFMSRELLPLMFKCEDGWERTVIHVTSQAAFLEEPLPGIGLVGYRMTKAAENGLMVGMHELYVAPGPGEAIRGAGNHLHRVVSVHPGFVQTGLGIETFKNDNKDELVQVKKEMGAIPVSEGADSLLWLGLASSGITSGKMYYLRAIHSF